VAAALHPRERAALDRRPSGDRHLAALRCRTRKEALLKGRGAPPVAGSVDPAGVHVGLAPPAVDGPGGRMTTTVAAAGWTLVDLPPAPLVTDRCVVVTLVYRAGRRVKIDVVETGFTGLMRGREPPPVEVRTSHRSGVG
jgi:hypothetical protein